MHLKCVVEWSLAAAGAHCTLHTASSHKCWYLYMVYTSHLDIVFMAMQFKRNNDDTNFKYQPEALMFMPERRRSRFWFHYSYCNEIFRSFVRLCDALQIRLLHAAIKCTNANEQWMRTSNNHVKRSFMFMVLFQILIKNYWASALTSTHPNYILNY